MFTIQDGAIGPIYDRRTENKFVTSITTVLLPQELSMYRHVKVDWLGLLTLYAIKSVYVS